MRYELLSGLFGERKRKAIKVPFSLHHQLNTAKFSGTQMRKFSTNDLTKRTGKVLSAATNNPVLITRNRKPSFVVMSYEHFHRIATEADPRRVFGVGETPNDLQSLFREALEHLATGSMT
jgi:prevent-host-death family protein